MQKLLSQRLALTLKSVPEPPDGTLTTIGLFGLFFGRRKSRPGKEVRSEPLEPRHCLSTVGFVSHEVFSSSLHEPKQVLTADFDADGDVDAAVSSTRGVDWYVNLDGAGTFGPNQTISNIPVIGAKSMQLGDIDRDGDIDVVAASTKDWLENEEVHWYENDGHAEFSSNFIVRKTDALDGVDTQPVLLNLADVDADGDLDLLVAARRNMTWFTNTDGVFARGPSYRTERAFRSLLTSDVNGDGAADVVGVYHDKIVWFANSDKQGILDEPRAITIVDGEIDPTREDSGEIRPVSVNVGDMDGDGDDDVVAAYSRFECPGGLAFPCDEYHFIEWFENENGQGDFQKHDITNETVATSAIQIADMDGDGDSDVAIGAQFLRGNFPFFQYEYALIWIENVDGSGNFANDQNHITSTRRNKTIHVADVDGDKDNDLLQMLFYSDRVSWLENVDGAGNFGEMNAIAISDMQSLNQLQVVDMDGDGDPDVLSRASYIPNERQVSWFENTGTGQFGQQQLIVEANPNVNFAFAADLDGDGDTDLLTSSGEFGIHWLENINGKASFLEHQIFDNWSGTIIGTDLDNDGDTDIFAFELVNGIREFVWYENKDGLGDFGNRRIIVSDTPNMRSTEPADLDGDGDLDLLFGSVYGRDGVVWYENEDGRGGFGDARIIANRSAINTATAADVDGDGDLDVITASYTEEGEDEYTDRLEWYENTDGQGTYGPRRLISRELIGVISPVGGDMDGDGDLDVVATAGYYGNEVAWFENTNGKGLFDQTPRLISMGDSDFRTINVADLDEDGDLDVLGEFADDVITWHENRLLGDVNNDGIFNSSDLVRVFQFGEYEDDIQRNSTFEEGDWDGDGDFTTSDLVHVFQAGTYSTNAVAGLAASVIDLLFDADDLRNERQSLVP